MCQCISSCRKRILILKPEGLESLESVKIKKTPDINSKQVQICIKLHFVPRGSARVFWDQKYSGKFLYCTVDLNEDTENKVKVLV